MSKKIKGLSRLNAALEKLKTISEEVRESLEEKTDWLDEKTIKYQESKEGEEWSSHISEVQDLLDEIDYLEPING